MSTLGLARLDIVALATVFNQPRTLSVMQTHAQTWEDSLEEQRLLLSALPASGLQPEVLTTTERA